jgi:hypothetical protein
MEKPGDSLRKDLESCGEKFGIDFLLRNNFIFENRKLEKVFHTY